MAMLQLPNKVQTTARFAPGQVIRHRRLGYRGLIFDVDASFSQSTEWHDTVDDMSASDEGPWYHILVDGGKNTSYVCEENLIYCDQTDEFEHPLFDYLFECTESGNIASRVPFN